MKHFILFILFVILLTSCNQRDPSTQHASLRISAASSLISQLTDETIDQFALGDPESVPAGMYAKQALEHAKVWEAVKDKAVYGKNVRQVASYIQSQNVKAGFVYQSDVQALTDVQQSQVIPEQYHEPITYPLGIINEPENSSIVKGFIKYLKGSEAKKVFQSYGFVPIE